MSGRVGGERSGSRTEHDETERRATAVRDERNRAEAADMMERLLASMPVALTPQAVLAMLHRRLSGLDERIEAAMSGLSDSTAEAEQLQGILADLQAMKAAGNEGDGDGDVGVGDMAADELNNAIGRLQTQGVDIGLDGRGLVEGNTIQALIDHYSGELRAVNSGNEMLMIELQSATQQRQSEIQLASSIIKILQETASGVIANFR